MKRRTIWEVNTGEALIVKRCTMVNTNQELEDEVVTSVNHITIIEDTKEDTSIEDEEGVRATVDELKEINTNTTKNVLRIGLINGRFLKHYYA